MDSTPMIAARGRHGAGEMALKGELSEFTVEQALRLLQLSGQTGTLDVRGPVGRAGVEVTGGAVSNVRGPDEPEAALGRALLGSTNGTFVDGVRLTGDRLLRGGETIRVGETTFVYERLATGS